MRGEGPASARASSRLRAARYERSPSRHPRIVIAPALVRRRQHQPTSTQRGRRVP
jgi:hypothetical protein